MYIVGWSDVDDKLFDISLRSSRILNVNLGLVKIFFLDEYNEPICVLGLFPAGPGPLLELLLELLFGTKPKIV